MNKFDLMFQYVMPFTFALLSFFILIKILHRFYEYTDFDKILPLTIKIGLVVGIITVLIFCIINSPYYGQMKYWLMYGTQKVQQSNTWQLLLYKLRKFLLWLLYWGNIYLKFVILIWVPCGYISLQGLYWQISFQRSANIIIPTIVLFPYLMLKYIGGYQTPFFDFIHQKLYRAKLKENLNDSDFAALSGFDDRGNRFESGVGGTAQTQRVKARALAMRHSKVKVQTINGVRKAEIFIRKSRETDTDKAIEQSLNGFGLRLTAASIRFPENPTFSVDKGGYVFESNVPYSTVEALGTWEDNFNNHLDKDQENVQGININGQKFWLIFWHNCRNVLNYFTHLTPAAYYERIQYKDAIRFYRDPTINKDHFNQIEHNLSLKLIPEPLDPNTGANVGHQKEIAKNVAVKIEPDLSNVLNSFKINATFKQILVGGNTAVYEYTLPQSPNLPNDFDRLSKGISNLLHINDTPMITMQAGVLSVSLNTGVNIPVDFREMIKNRANGVTDVVSGVVGIDALGHPIEFALGDAVPHMIVFGKTGTGKTVLLMNMIYSVMDAVNPEELKIIYIDGKGNSFEGMRTDNADSPDYHPNPYTYTQPADASGDVEYARALFAHVEKMTRDRIDIFKKSGVSKIEDYNKKFPDKKLYTVLLICDEISSIIDQDNKLKASEYADKNVTDRIEYLAKMSRSTGIRMILANQTARKEKIPGKITANIGGRISLGMTERIESDIALPEAGIHVDLISQRGEFYSLMKGANNPEHGNTPYLNDDTLNALNDDLERKFGHHDYVITRDEIMDEFDKEINGEEEEVFDEDQINEIGMPDIQESINKSMQKMPFQDLLDYIEAQPEWAVKNANKPVIKNNSEFIGATPKQTIKMNKALNEAINRAKDKIDARKTSTEHKHVGEMLSRGKDGKPI